VIDSSTPTVLRPTPDAPTPLAGEALKAMAERFPPRPDLDVWPATSESLDQVLARVDLPPLRAAKPHARQARRRGVRRILEWLETFEGETWQQRWNASPAGRAPGREWHAQAASWIGPNITTAQQSLNSGLLTLICADVLRPSFSWQLSRGSTNLRPVLTRIRDVEGFAKLEAAVGPAAWTSRLGILARNDLMKILVAKGGTLADITVGDALEYVEATRNHEYGNYGHTLFYAWLHQLGTLSDDAPNTIRFLARTAGQVSVEQLVDRYNVRCKPIRDLIVDYIKERRSSVDYNTLMSLSGSLVKLFWADLEHHHPGINSLRLEPEVISAWKQRARTKVERRRQRDGSVRETITERVSYPSLMMSVRAFYLDISQWAIDEPARWGPWVAPCPVDDSDVILKKTVTRRKARMDQRTRERLPTLPALASFAKRHLDDAKARLEALLAAPPEGQFTAFRTTYTRARSVTSTRAVDPDGRRVDFGLAEHRAFWAWASIEFFQHTGARIEEMLEVSHHSLIQYKLPKTGEVVPLLQIAPSKTDEERVILVNPELADVLSTIISRVRDPRTRAIASVSSYDVAEKSWNPPMPLLFQWQHGSQRLQMSQNHIRSSLNELLEASGMTDAAGQPLHFTPHDFRRIFITDAIRSGLPPHIAQVLAGHSNINTTMGYNAIYPADVIEAHRAFIARRRTLRPSEEYRTPTSEEWDSFLAHFEKRKLSLGTCARAFGTSCIHEHACIRCSLLRPEPSQRLRLIEIRDNLLDRIAEAHREGWVGEVEGLQVSLAGAEEKIAQLQNEENRRTGPVDLGIPTFGQIAGRTSTIESP
jgi:integrase